MRRQFQNFPTLSNLLLNFGDPQQSLRDIGVILSEQECIEFIKHNFNPQFFPNLTNIDISAVEKAEGENVYVAQDLNVFHEQLTTLRIKDSQCLSLDVLHLYKFSNLTNLTFTNCSISKLPASVGKLENLKELILSRNKLSSLPYFIVYCKNLELLDLSKNQFEYLPGYLQELQNIKTLRRLDNPLVETVKGSQLQAVITKQIPTKENERSNVPPLQSLCLPVIIRFYPNYWDLAIAPTLCRMLDANAENIVYCERCFKPGFKPDFFILYSILFRCYGLNLVPFGHYSCSTECNCIIKERVQERYIRIKNTWESEYSEMVIRHNAEFRNSMPPQTQNTRGQNNIRKCEIL